MPPPQGAGEWGGRAACDLPRLPRDAVLAPPGVAGGDGSKGVAGDAPGGGVLCVIPARLRAVRFPGKLLADLAGQSVLQRTWARARSAAACARVVVATDAEEIRAHVQGFGGEALMTRSCWRSGTERVYEVRQTRLVKHARPDWSNTLMPSALIHPPQARNPFTRGSLRGSRVGGGPGVVAARR